MPDKEAQVRALLTKTLEDGEEYARTYEHYAADMKDFSARVQWRFGPIKGYQIYKGTEYSFGDDAEIEDPDILIECDDLRVARGFFRNEYEDMRDLAKTDFQITSPKFADSDVVSPFRLMSMLVTKLPAFRPIVERTEGTGQSSGVAIPINQSLGTYKNEIIPYAVLEHFINKASHVFLYDLCPCRENRSCEHYDHYEYGCMVLGRGVLRMKPGIRGHLATKEEALERARKGIEAGLLPQFGRLRGDAINRIGGPIPDTGDLFNMCYCCPCCCVVGGIKHSPSYIRTIFQRMEGVTITVDRDVCTDCGICAGPDVCIYGGMEMVDGRLVFDEAKCFGCGRCESACPTSAISISMDEDSVERMIARIESRVDIT
jgi:UDP-glucose 4-epimerase